VIGVAPLPPFDAVAGSKCRVTLKGEGVEAGNVTLVRPDGPVAFEPKGKSGKVTVKVVLTSGTGTCTVRWGTSLTVNAEWSLKLPKVKGTVME